MSIKTKEALAYALAKDAHEGQRYGKHDYFEYHVLGVASSFWHVLDEAYIVALLHDVVEDSEISHDCILDLFGTSISRAVVALTRDKNIVRYEDYISLVTRSDIAIKVKIADLKFHLSQPELKNEAKYRKALAYLESQ